MQTPFEKMKLDSQSGVSLKRIRKTILEKTKKPSRGRIDLFVQDSLKINGHWESVKSLKECHKGQYRGNIYCRTCRDRMGLKMLRRYQSYLSRENMSESSCRARLRHITIIHGLIPADKKQVKTSQKNVRNKYNSFSRKWPNAWYQGAFEYELIDMQKVLNHIHDQGSQSRKKAVLLDLVGCKPDMFEERDSTWTDDDGNKRSDYILLHTHFLMDAAQYKWADISDNMRKRWPSISVKLNLPFYCSSRRHRESYGGYYPYLKSASLL